MAIWGAWLYQHLSLLHVWKGNETGETFSGVRRAHGDCAFEKNSMHVRVCVCVCVCVQAHHTYT